MVLGHLGIGLAVKKKTRNISLVWVLVFSILPEVLLPGVIFAPFFPSLVKELGFIEFAMRCASSGVLIGVLSLILIGMSVCLNRLKYGLVLSGCMFLCVLSNFHVEAYWLFPLSHINLGLGIYPWNPWFWVIDLTVFVFCLAYFKRPEEARTEES